MKATDSNAVLATYYAIAAAPSDRAAQTILGKAWTKLPVTFPFQAKFLDWCAQPGSRFKLREALMTGAELMAWRALPCVVTCYRGGSSPEHDRQGLSWSLDRHSAERHMREAVRRQLAIGEKPTPTLLRATFANPHANSELLAAKIEGRDTTVIVRPDAWAGVTIESLL